MRMRRCFLCMVAVAAIAANAQALPLTSFTINGSGGFDAVIFPELTNGTFSLQSAVFTLPQAVNPGWVIIVDDPSLSIKDTSNWNDVIHFIDNGKGKALSMQMFVSGPDQSQYFPVLKQVMNQPHVAIADQSAATGGFTQFTEYSVSGKQVRNYSFFTASVPENGSSAILLGIALAAMFVCRRVFAKS